MSQQIRLRRIAPFIQSNWQRRAEPLATPDVGNFSLDFGQRDRLHRQQAMQPIADPLGDFSEQTGAQFG